VRFRDSLFFKACDALVEMAHRLFEVAAVPKDGSVEVSVSDTGVGIAPEDQEAVFEEFPQVGTAEKKAEGTGPGLTLCRKFVELHGGRIWVTSQGGVGSTFSFMIPVRCGNEGPRLAANSPVGIPLLIRLENAAI
jgi:signal transduction histidine kinase